MKAANFFYFQFNYQHEQSQTTKRLSNWNQSNLDKKYLKFVFRNVKIWFVIFKLKTYQKWRLTPVYFRFFFIFIHLVFCFFATRMWTVHIYDECGDCGVSRQNFLCSRANHRGSNEHRANCSIFESRWQRGKREKSIDLLLSCQIIVNDIGHHVRTFSSQLFSYFHFADGKISKLLKVEWLKIELANNSRLNSKIKHRMFLYFILSEASVSKNWFWSNLNVSVNFEHMECALKRRKNFCLANLI